MKDKSVYDSTKEKIFIVARDPVKNKEIAKQFLEIQTTKEYIKIPYYCDEIFLDVYKQKITENDFIVKEENFIGKVRLNIGNNMVCMRDPQATVIKERDKNGNVVFSEKSDVFLVE